MASDTRTYKNAPHKKGSFPIIIYAPSFSQPPWENLDLCKYLASYGYIVVSSPSFNKNSRAMSFEIESLIAQAKDQEFLVNFIKSFPNADASKIASLGYSWGATSNIIAAERQKQFDAIICLDGAIEFWYKRFVKQTPYLDPLKMKIPFFAMSLPPPSEKDRRRRKRQNMLMDLSFIFFQSLKHSDAYRVTFSKMAHHFFRGSSQRLENTANEKDRSDLKARHYCYQIMCQYTLKFFDTYIKGDKKSEMWLKMMPEEKGFPKNYVNVEYKAAKKKTTSDKK